MNIKLARALVFAAITIVGAAGAETGPRLSNTGLGAATWGMSLKQVEHALGTQFALGAGQQKHWLMEECSVETKNMPGVIFIFDHGRLLAVSLSESARLLTHSGIAVGDPERKAIGLFRSDPTYRRDESRYDDGSKTSMEITVGKATFDAAANTARGMQMKVSSRKGKIVTIVAGRASYIMMDEHEGGDECR